MIEMNVDSFQPSKVLKNAKRRFTTLHDSVNINRGETGRGLNISPERSFPEQYSETLPLFDGKNINLLIQDAIDKNEKEAKNTSTSYKPPLIVDIGYGAGYFLLESKRRWGDKIKCIGYGPILDTQIPYLGNPPTHKSLIDAGIELVEGNIIEIDKSISNANILTASHIVEWIHYPHWELIKKLYRILAQDGVGLVNKCQLIPENDAFNLGMILEKEGYQFEIGKKHKGDIAFRRTKPKITVPIIGTPNKTNPTDFSHLRLIKNK